jgi:hypothetical protein
VEAAYSNGISVTFLKKHELMAGDSWSSKPLSPANVINNLSKYDAIWCAQLVSQYNRPVWYFLRHNRPDQIMLYYISGNTARETELNTYLNYDYINTHHPEWFLLNDTKDMQKADVKKYENRIRWEPNDEKSPYYNRFFIDVGNKDFQNWAAEEIVKRVSGKQDNLTYGYDGLAMDNVSLVALERLLTKRHPNWKYAGNPEGWVNAYFEYLKVVHEALVAGGYILVVNHTTDYSSNRDGNDWEKIMQISDGLMDEDSLGAPGDVLKGSKWLWTVKHHEDTLARGLSDWWVCRPVEDERMGHEQFLYTYCTFLLTKKSGKSFYCASRGASGYDNTKVPWYEEYDLPIGNPKSARYSQDQCWLRDYENAKIIVNPTEQTQKITVSQDKYWYSPTDNKAVSRLELKPGTGRILLPTPYPAGSKLPNTE